MFSKRRLSLGILIAIVLTLASAAPALAGGWTNVTLDTLPTDARPGQPLSLGFMVRQHGVTPINGVTPRLDARNAATGETISATARQEGAVGHFVAEITFPSAGTWEWSITPVPFPRVDLGKVTIVSATTAPQSGGFLRLDTPDAARLGARWLGVVFLVAALGIALRALASRPRVVGRGQGIASQ